MGTIIFATFLLLTGAVCLYFSVLTASNQIKLLRRGLRAPATIVAVNEVKQTGEGEPELTTYYPIFEFKGTTHRVYRVTADSGSRLKKVYAPGQSVQVMYYLGKEEQATIHSVRALWMLPLACLGLAIVMLAGAYVFFTNGDQPNRESLAQPPIVGRSQWRTKPA